MAKDIKVIQKGANVQSNDLAVEPGTAQHEINFSHIRDGVSSRRVGFDSFWNGMPQQDIDVSSLSAATFNGQNAQRGIFELMSKDHLFCLSNGMIFSYIDNLSDASYGPVWKSVPANLSHRFRLLGDDMSLGGSSKTNTWMLGKAIGNCLSTGSGGFASAFSTLDLLYFTGSIGTALVGAITNSTAQASASAPIRFFDPFDVVVGYVSDNTTIRSSINGSVLAGSITVSGSTDGVGTAARFNGASWMATDGSATLWVADNTNEIRKVVISSGSVTTLAGSVTAGDIDGVGTAARFRNISGLAYDGSQFLYALESGGNRIRKVDVNSGSVTIFAGSLSSASGYVDAIGTSARFNSPTGIEYISGFLYVGDTNNSVIREVQVSNAQVRSYTFNTNNVTPRDGMIGGLSSQAVLPGVVLRGKYTRCTIGGTPGYEWNIGTWLSIECAANASTDLGLVSITSQGSIASSAITDRIALHYARCPGVVANPTSGPMKLDTVGPNAYSSADVRGVDVGSGCVFSTREYPRAIDAWTKQVEADPMPRLRPLGIDAPEAPSLTTVGGGTTFQNNTSWAYRTVCGLSLPDGRVILGPPSERIIATNTSGGVVDCNVTAYPSAGLPYDGMAFIQVYRTQTFPSSVDPGDQMFLALESAISYGAGLFNVDKLPDGLLGAELYTNATQPGGFASAALRPPLWANEITSFGNKVVLANYTSPGSARIKVLGTSPLSAGSSTVTFSTYGYAAGQGLTFTAVSGATDPGNRNFQIGTGGSAAQNAAQTARNIVLCINRCPDAFMFKATYDESDPGAFVVTSMFPGLMKDQYLKATSSTGIAAVGTNVQSYVSFSTNATTAFMTIERQNSIRNQNAIAYTDPADFDSFPVGNTRTVGPATESIVRMLPISDRLIAVKDDSVWATDAEFTPQIYDTALSCSLPNSFARVNNQWIGLFTRGFVALNTTQAVAIGRAVERDVSSQYGQLLKGLQYPTNFASAAAIDLSGEYVCTFNKRTYCYNAITGMWSEWSINSNTPIADLSASPTSAFQQRTSGVRYIGSYLDRFVAVLPECPRGIFLQRSWKATGTQLLRDYGDMAWVFAATLGADLKTASVASYSSGITNPGIYPPTSWTPPQGSTSPVSMASVTALWHAQIQQGGNSIYSQCSVVPTSAGSTTSPLTITLTSALASPFVAGACTITAYAPIVCSVQWSPTFAPGVNANFNEALVTMERCQPGYLVGRFFNRYDLGSATVQTSGLYENDQGVCRAISMAQVVSSLDPVNARIAYHDEQRFDVPSDRSYDQQMAVELWEATAWQPLAIKAVVIDHRAEGSGKTKQ